MRIVGSFAAALFALTLAAPEAHAIFIVNDPWVRAQPGAKSAEAFMELTSTEGATLVAVRSESAKSVAIRTPGKAVRVIAELPLAPRVPLLLAPGKYRLGLIALDKPLRLGDRVPLTLTIRAADGSEREIPVRAEVRRRSAVDDHVGHKHAH